MNVFQQWLKYKYNGSLMLLRVVHGLLAILRELFPIPLTSTPAPPLSYPYVHNSITIA